MTMINEIKSYPVTWQGQLVLACRKCQKKLKSKDHMGSLANLKQLVKRMNKKNPQNLLHLINVPCMDLCPKNAVTICVPGQSNDRLYILRSEKDLDIFINNTLFTASIFRSIPNKYF